MLRSSRLFTDEQVLLPLLKSDLVDVVEACLSGTLKNKKVEFHDNLVATSIVAASGGYKPQYRRIYNSPDILEATPRGSKFTVLRRLLRSKMSQYSILEQLSMQKKR